MTTDERFDESITSWLEATAPSRLPERVLDATFERTRGSRQRVRWGGLLGPIHLTRSTLVLGGTAAIVVAAVLALSPRVAPPAVGELPTTPDAWSRVSIGSPWATAQVDALVAGPRGLLAILGEAGSHEVQLSVSTDGRTWRLVPNDQFPSDAVLLPRPGSLRLPAVGTAHGFLFVADGNDVWASDDGYRWQRLTDRARDQDLRAGSLLAMAVGGPGLIAVGSDNKAWYSEDGSDWTQAEVPAPPLASFEALGLPPPTVSMQGVAVSGETIVAWGTASSGTDSNDGMQQTVLWTSGDGKSWANVPDAEGIEPLRTVVAGPGGFVATDMNGIDDARAIRFSADGRSWETVDAFESRLPSFDEGLVSSVAAASSGYVAVGGDGKCAMEPCPDAVATIWTSPDGRSWSRLPGGGLFQVADPQKSANHSGAWATSAAAWDSRFIVAGAYDASPVVWISGTPGETEAPIVTATPNESQGASATPSPSMSTTEVAPPSESPVELPSDGTVVEPGSFSVTVDGYSYKFDVPSAGWQAKVVSPAETPSEGRPSPDRADVELTVGDASDDPPDLAGLGLWGNATQVHRLRCQELMGASNDVGPTAADLATAIASLDGFMSSGPTDVTVGRYRGKRLQLSVPRDSWAACTEGSYRYAYGSFTDEDGKDREYQGPEQIDDIWILDLDNGHRQLFLITYFPTTPTERVDELRQMIESLDVEPAEGDSIKIDATPTESPNP